MKKKLQFIFCFFAAIGLFSALSCADVHAASKSREEATRWTLSQEGKGLDYDGAYGNQCVDLIKYYYAYLGVTGYARGNGCDYANNSLPPGWRRIPYSASSLPQPGDIAVWGKALSSSGHVAIVLSSTSSGFVSMDQNWPRGSNCKKVNHTYNKFWGIIRPDWPVNNRPDKTKVTSDSRTYQENADITFKWDRAAWATGYWVDIWCNGKGIESFASSGLEYTLRNVKAGKYTIFVTSTNSSGNAVSDGYNVYVGGDLGTNFEAVILRKDVWKPIEAINGDNVEIGEEEGDANERWRFERQSDGSYVILNLDTNKALDVHNWGGTGTNVQVYRRGESLQTNQQWYICPSFGGYVLAPKHGSGIVLDCSGGGSGKGTNIQVWEDNETGAQLFEIYKVQDPVFGALPYVNKGDDFYGGILNMKYWAALTIDENPMKNDNSKHNVCFTKIDNARTRWHFVRNKNGSYTIYSCLNGKVLEVSATTERANIQAGPYTGGSDQQWFIFGESADYYLRTPYSDYVLDMSEGKYSDRVNAQTYRYWKDNEAQKSQIWVFNELIGNVADCEISLPKTVYDHTGKEIKPTMIVKNGKTILKEGKDYVLSYKNNVKAGTATVMITGIGKYTGIAGREFTIKEPDNVDRHEHSFSDIWKSDRDSHWKECRCGKKSGIEEHLFQWIIDQAPTTTEVGLKHQECSVCSYTKNDNTVIDRLPEVHVHDYGDDWKSDGDSHWKECGCGKKSGIEEHLFQWIIDQAPTTTEVGLKHQECSVCGYTKNDGTVIDRLPEVHVHDYGNDWRFDGDSHWKECVCGEKEDVIPHSFEWIIDKEATTTETGLKHQECNVCKYTKDNNTVIEQLGNDSDEDDPAVIMGCYEININGTGNKAVYIKSSSLEKDKIKSVKSSDSKIAKVYIINDGRGIRVCSVKKGGTAVIHLTMESGAEAEMTVNVPNIQTLSKSSVVLRAGRTVTVSLKNMPSSPRVTIKKVSGNKSKFAKVSYSGKKIRITAKKNIKKNQKFTLAVKLSNGKRLRLNVVVRKS